MRVNDLKLEKMRIVYKVMYNIVMYKRYVRKFREIVNVEYWMFYVLNILVNKGFFLVDVFEI